MMVAQKGKPSVLEVLIVNSANRYLKQQDGWTASHIAAWHDQVEWCGSFLLWGLILKILIAGGVLHW